MSAPAPHPRRRRVVYSAVDVLRLVAALVAFGVVLLIVNFGKASLSGAERDLIRLTARLPSGVTQVAVRLVQLVALFAPIVGAGALIVRRHFRRLTGSVVAAVAGLVLGRWVMTDLLELDVDRFRITGAPADALLTYSIRQPVEGTDAAVRERLMNEANGDEAKVLQRPVSTPLAQLTDEQGITRLDVPIRSRRGGDTGRAWIPNAGAYPVVVTVTTAGREQLLQSTLYLLRPPVDPPANPFRVGIVIDHELPAGFGDDGAPAVTDALRGTIASMTDELKAADGLPVGLAVRPESLAALAQSPASADPRSLAALRGAVGDADVLRLPWAELHTEGWAQSGSLRDVQTSLLQGQETLFDSLGVRTDAAVWPTDATLGPEGVDLLGKVGVNGVLVDPERLAAMHEGFAYAGLATCAAGNVCAGRCPVGIETGTMVMNERARRRMMAAVPRATVVIANPTHYAVALRYVREEGGAPLVIAKGKDLIALKIRELAEEHGIPVIENKPLARALYKAVEVDKMIPKEFYKAVAEIIFYLSQRQARIRPIG